MFSEVFTGCGMSSCREHTAHFGIVGAPQLARLLRAFAGPALIEETCMSARAGSKRIAAISVAIVTSIAFACSSDSTQPDNPSGPKFSAPLPIEAGATIGAATYASGDSSTGGQGAPVDGIACDTTTPVQHIHVHLTLIADGQQRAIPIAIGVGDPFILQNFVVAARCYYWLHTHDATGIVHVEAPVTTTFNLGQFFAIWGQPLSSGNVAGFTGTVTAYVDSTLYTGDLAAIDFQEHRQITLIVGAVPDTIPVYAFPADY
jgi:hypothetical protein